jgi:hypothetical protein
MGAIGRISDVTGTCRHAEKKESVCRRHAAKDLEQVPSFVGLSNVRDERVHRDPRLTELFRLQFVAEILLRELSDSTAFVDLLTDAGADWL